MGRGSGCHTATRHHCTVDFLGLASEPVQEGHVGEQTILVLGVTQLSEQLLDVVLGDLVTEVAEDVVQLSQHHGAVAVLVVQLEELQVVVVGALRVGGGDSGLALLHDIVVLGELLALLVSLTLGDTGLLGDVQAKSVHHVSEEEEVNLAFAIPVVDVADVLDLCLKNFVNLQKDKKYLSIYVEREKEGIFQIESESSAGRLPDCVQAQARESSAAPYSYHTHLLHQPEMHVIRQLDL